MAAVLALALGVVAPPGQAQEGQVLQSVDVVNLPGNRVQVDFRMSGPAAEPRSFAISSPARIVLDFPQTKVGLAERRQTIGAGVAQSLTVLEGSDRARATLNLTQAAPYSIRTVGEVVRLTLGETAADVAQAAPAAAEAPTPAVAPVTRGLRDVDFRRGADGQGIVAVTLGNPGTGVDVRQEGNRIVADFIGAPLPREQLRRLDVSDFATPVMSVEATNVGRNARLVIAPTGRFEFLAYQTDNAYTIEVKPIKEETQALGRENVKRYSGEQLSLNFQDIEVRAVLQVLADFTGLNVVVDDSVQGNLTLRLQNVPWDQAMDIIMQTKGLTSRQTGNVIYVAPTTVVAEQEKARQEVADVIPMQTDLIQINYAKAADLAEILKTDQGSGEDERGLLSSRGTVTVDPRTNSLLVQDIPQRLQDVRALIGRLDIPVRQVMIDSRVVIATDDFSKELGVRFGATGVRQHSGGIATISGSAASADATVSSAAGDLAGSVAIPNLADRLGVNLATTSNPFGRLGLALLGRHYLLDLELSALQAEGRGETLSNPRVLTTDRKEAVVKQGFEVPYVSVSSSGTNVQFKEAVLKLQVIPQITPDRRVIMDLTITKDEPDFTRAVQGNPPLNKREIATQVLVDNGETVVLGGVFEQVTTNSVDKVPLLGDLPHIGRLFQRHANSNRKLELLIFVTPQIITEGLSLR